MEDKGANVSSRCSVKETISMIKEHLHADTLREFGRICFGRFLHFNPHKYQGQMMHHLMLHLKDESELRGMLTYCLQSCDVVFGARDYFIMTGLSFGPSCELDTTSTIYEKVCSVEENFPKKWRSQNGSDVPLG